MSRRLHVLVLLIPAFVWPLLATCGGGSGSSHVDTTFSGTWCIDTYGLELVIDRQGPQAEFTMEMPSGQPLHGSGTAAGNQMALAAIDEMGRDVTLDLTFAADAASLDGTYRTLENGTETERIDFTAQAGACPACAPQQEVVMTTPYGDVNEIDVVSGAFCVSHTNCPWGLAHNGIDIVPVADGAGFQAVADGTVEMVELRANELTGNWQVNVRIRHNCLVSTGYVFEPMTDRQADGQVQLERILACIHEGDVVSAGDCIGELYWVAGTPHVHFSYYRDNQHHCPEGYFEPAAEAQILQLLQRQWPAADRLCYD